MKKHRRPSVGTPRRRTAGPLVESLEQRILLSVVTWTGEGNGSFWSDPNNWSTHALPTAGDDVVVSGNTTEDISALTVNNLSFSGNSSLTLADDEGFPVSFTVGGNINVSGQVNIYTGAMHLSSDASTITTTATGDTLTWAPPYTVAGAKLTVAGPGTVIFGDAAFHSTPFTLTAETDVTSGSVQFNGAVTGKIDISGGNAGFFVLESTLASLVATGGTVTFDVPQTVAGDLILGAGATVSSDISGRAMLIAQGDVTLGATLSVADNTDYLIEKDSSGPVSGTFAGLPDGATFSVDGTEHRILYHAGFHSSDTNDVIETIGDVDAPTAALTPPTVHDTDTGTTFSITFNDATGVSNTAIIGNNNLVQVTGPNGYSAFATFVSLSGTPSADVATYSLTPPGGTWDSADSGTYTVTVLPGVTDLPGNPMGTAIAGTFQFGSTAAIDQRFFLSPGADVTSAGGTSTRFTLTYTDPAMVATVQGNNHLVKVTGPHGFAAFATFVSQTTQGGTHIATFQLAAPGGTWDAADAGAYTVTISGKTVIDQPATGDSADQPAVFYMSPTPLFDERFYVTHNADVAAAIKSGALSSGWQHFEAFGQFEHRQPSAIYNEQTYLMLNPDVAAAVKAGWFKSGFDHLLKVGLAEGREVTPLFDAGYYIAHNTDVAAALQSGAISSAFQHFVTFGQYEGRDPSAYFNTDYYEAHNAGAEASAGVDTYDSVFAQFLATGESAGDPASTLFDEAAYDARYPDVAAAIRAGKIKSGLEHYLLFGKKEGRVATA